MPLFGAIKYSIYYVKRGKREFGEFRERIENEGGKVTSASRVGFFVKSPFGGLRQNPLYYAYEVEYPARRGIWYVAASADNPQGLWAWRDRQGLDTLPVERADDARVDNRASALGLVPGIALGWGVILVFIVILWYSFLN